MILKIDVQGAAIVRFTHEFSRWEPERFVQTVLVDWLHVSEVWVGANFLFCRERAGNFTLLTGSMVNYLVPSAAELPSFEVDRVAAPSPTNPMGVKGVGETGTIASTAAVMNAVVDALSPYGITDIDMPASPERVWRAIEEARP